MWIAAFPGFRIGKMGWWGGLEFCVLAMVNVIDLVAYMVRVCLGNGGVGFGCWAFLSL